MAVECIFPLTRWVSNPGDIKFAEEQLGSRPFAYKTKRKNGKVWYALFIDKNYFIKQKDRMELLEEQLDWSDD
jgi:hypothetical protein